VIRDRQIVYQSTPQTHGFNFPRQLGAESEDLPEHADSKDIDVLEGDVVVLGTDGLFDNLSHEKVVSSVVQAKSTPKYQRASSAEDRIQVNSHSLFISSLPSPTNTSS
jgi:serine/threonine protein phosphatase PrpC